MKNIFKRREPKYKQTSENDPWIIKTWNTSQGRAGIKLALYGLFVLVVFALIIFKGEAKKTVFTSTYHSTSVPYEEKLNSLTSSNYEYTYRIIIYFKT